MITLPKVAGSTLDLARAASPLSQAAGDGACNPGFAVIERDVAYRWRTMRFNPIRHLTPQIMARALDEFDLGWLRMAALLFEVIEDRDDTLKIAAGKRKKSPARQPWEIIMTDDSPEAEQDKEDLEFFYNNLTTTNAIDLNERGTVSHLLRQMMNAFMVRYAVHEIVWQPTEEGLTAQFRFVPLYFFENRIGRLRYIGPANTAIGLDLEDNGWMITTGEGIMPAAASCYLLKRFSLQDWMNFSEKFGMPGIHGETPAAPDSKEFNDFVEALDKFANEWIIATTTGAKINLIEASKNGDAPFEPMVERMDRKMTALCRGGDLSTMSSHGGGGNSGRGASLQKDEEVILTEDDCIMLSETLNMQVDTLVIQSTRGRKPKAYFKLLPPQQRDVNADLAIDTFLLAAGAQLGVADAMERYGRAAPSAGEPLLKQSAAPPNQMQPAEKDAAANEHSAKDRPAQMTEFLAGARKLLGNSFAEAMQPIRKELSAVLAANDEDLSGAVEAVKAALKTHGQGIIQFGGFETTWGRVLSASFFNGVAGDPEGATPPKS
jgi:phage gp29-like protein